MLTTRSANPVFSAAPSIASHMTNASIWPLRSAAIAEGPAPVAIPVY